MKPFAFCLAAAVAVLLAGCASMLPRGSSDTPSPFASYSDAQAAAGKIVPFKRRVTHVTGWWFEAMLVVSEDTVLFRNMAGNAHIERVEKQTNPLGPLQDAGEAAGSILLN